MAERKVDIDRLTIAELFLYHLKSLSEDQLEVLEKLNLAVNIGAGYGYPANTSGIQIVRVVIMAANTPMQGPEMTIPDGFNLLIKSHPLNPAASLIYVAESKPQATDPNGQYPLVPNENVTYGVKNASSIWVAGFMAPFPAAGLAVVFTAEKA